MADEKTPPPPPLSDETTVDFGVFREARDERVDLGGTREHWIEKSTPMVSATAPEPAPPKSPDLPSPAGGADEGSNQD
jgi:hypothetical protein